MNFTKKQKYIIFITAILLFLSIFIFVLLDDYNLSTEISNNLSPTEHSSVIYDKNGGDESENEIISNHNAISNAHESIHTHPELQTVFDYTENVEELTNFQISEPIVIREFNELNEFEIIDSNQNNLLLFNNNNELVLFDSITDELILVDTNATKATKTENSSTVLYEKEIDGGYQTNQFDLSNEYSIEPIINTKTPVTTLGKIGEFIYFSNSENDNSIFYLSAPRSSAEADLLGFNEITNADKIVGYEDGYLTYSRESNALFKGQFGEGFEQFKKIPEDTMNLHLSIFTINPYVTESPAYLMSFSNSKDFSFGIYTFLNDTFIPELTDMSKMQWINRESILFSQFGISTMLYLYNFNENNLYPLATNISSFDYDETTNALYYTINNDNNLRKIIIK